jgi:16S rRNA (guanine527-N7)-methyltransferase
MAEAYAELLVGPGVERGLIGPGETERIWDRHLLNSAVVAELVPGGPFSRHSPNGVEELPGVLVDLGSGAGLPGIVLAMLLPAVSVVLVEPMARRTAFLTECVAELGLRNVEVRRGRAEDLAGQLAGDVVTARAVARLDQLAVLAAGIARPGALVLAVKGATAEQEVAEARPVLSRLGMTGVEVVSVGVGVVSQPTTVVRFRTNSGKETVRQSSGRGKGSRGRRSPA